MHEEKLLMTHGSFVLFLIPIIAGSPYAVIKWNPDKVGIILIIFLILIVFTSKRQIKKKIKSKIKKSI